MSQHKLLQEFFINNPNRNIGTAEVVDWAVAEWQKRTGKPFRDPDRGVRKLYQTGFLMQIEKGVYRYDPQNVNEKSLENFTPSQKKEIFKKDGYKCVICGLGKKDGVALHADHIKPRDKGGKADIKNGQTLCSQHNMFKKNLKQTEAGKKMFIRLHEIAKEEGDSDVETFCREILELYIKHNINGHIEWSG